MSFRRVRRCGHVVLRVQNCREAEVAVPMGKVAETCLFRRVRRCGHVVLRGRRGAL